MAVVGCKYNFGKADESGVNDMQLLQVVGRGVDDRVHQVNIKFSVLVAQVDSV